MGGLLWARGRYPTGELLERAAQYGVGDRDGGGVDRAGGLGRGALRRRRRRPPPGGRRLLWGGQLRVDVQAQRVQLAEIGLAPQSVDQLLLERPQTARPDRTVGLEAQHAVRVAHGMHVPGERTLDMLAPESREYRYLLRPQAESGQDLARKETDCLGGHRDERACARIYTHT